MTYTCHDATFKPFAYQEAAIAKKKTDTMKLTVKTLKGGKFQVDCETSNTVLQVKGIIVSRL